MFVILDGSYCLIFLTLILHLNEGFRQAFCFGYFGIGQFHSP